MERRKKKPPARALAALRVCIFAKPPLAGKVKTRLAAALGSERAAQLARAFLVDTLAAVRELSWADPLIATTGEMPAGIVPQEIEIVAQGEGDLGERLERVLRKALRNAVAAVAIGADAPGLPRRLFEEARTKLLASDAVVGPAADGGFYLLGLRRCPAGLLGGIPWSSAETSARTCALLAARGFSLRILPPWFDVDVPEDLPRLREALRDGSLRAPRTAQVLGEA